VFWLQRQVDVVASTTAMRLTITNLPDFWLDDQYQHELQSFWALEFVGVVARTTV
jgi:hypothetical protein